jgi:HEAT repeat protein
MPASVHAGRSSVKLPQMQSSGTGILGVFARNIRRLVSSFREKPAAKLDDYLLEHFMLYHGLVGSSPENQPRFKDVRRNIADALKHKSSSELAIALKLPPLWWEEKLQQIFAEAAPQFADELPSCLLPAGESFELPPESDPLRHPDWRVRANAAKAMAQLQMFDAVPRMVAALNDEDNEQKTAFCHIAYSLSRLQNQQSHQALAAHLYSDEPWFRVDAAGALACWPLAEVDSDLMTAIVEPHALTDYMAIAIVRRHQPTELLRQSDEMMQEGALEVVIGMLQAVQGTFSDDILIEARVHTCLPRLLELSRQEATPRRWRAVGALSAWIIDKVDDITFQDRTASKSKLVTQAREAAGEVSASRITQPLLAWLITNYERPDHGSQLRHAARLAGDIKLVDAAPYIVPLASLHSPALNESIDALASLGQKNTAPHLVQLARQLVDIDERASRTPSKQPVFEDNPAAAKTYWHILRALGSVPDSSAVEYLLTACRDFAADKRQQALSSLIALGQVDDLRQKYDEAIYTHVHEALSDPSPQVRTAALHGVADLKLPGLLPAVLRLAHAPETVVWRQADSTLQTLHAEGFAAPVEQSLTDAVFQERDQFKRQRLKSLLESLRT